MEIRHDGIAKRNRTLVEEGLIDEKTLRQAASERDAWYRDPRAFYFEAFAFVAGKVWLLLQMSTKSDAG